MSIDPVSFAPPFNSSPLRCPSSEQHLRIHSTSSSSAGSSSSSPPALAFVNLSERRGSLRSVDLDPHGRPVGGPWNESPRSRRGSLAKRSGDFSWSANKPASPVPSRRPSLTPSLSFNYASTGSGSPAGSGGGSHSRGRRPSSSSSAVTIRAGSPSQGGLLPFGHSFKVATAAARRSSLTPSTHVSHASIGSSSTTAVSIGGHISPASEHVPLGSPFFSPSPSRELRSYRFGTSPPPTGSLAGRVHRRPSYEPPESEDADAEDDDDDEIDRAREQFREHLLKAGLSSIPISFPPSPGARSSSGTRPKPVLGPVSRHAPYGTVVSSVDSSASSSHSGSNRTASNSRPHSSPAFLLERRPSGRHFNPENRLGPAAESSSEEDDAAPSPPPRLSLRQSMSRQSIDARRLGLEVRTVIRPADDGSGIEDESESEESELESHSSSSAQMLRHDGSLAPDASAGLSSNGTRSLAAWDSYDLGVQRAPPALTLPSPTHELIRHLAPAVGLEERPRRKSISPQQPLKFEPAEDRSLLGCGPTAGVRRGSKQDASPPRSLSDSAVPRRPSLAEELQATIPPVHLNPSGAASVGGNDDVEWDLDFVLGGSGPVSAELIAPEYQTANGMRTARPGVQFGSAALGLGPGYDQFGAPDMQNDSFAQFVRDKDPIFEEMRVAWTLVRPLPPSNEWALPTTGGYTYLHSLAALNSPSRSSIASSIDASSAPSLALGSSSAPHVQFRSPDPVLRANRPPGLAWAIKTRGRGWGIVPMQGTREEIKFGPKGKWRTNDNGVRSNRSSLSSKGPIRRSSSKDTEPRSRGGSGMSSESGMSIYVPDRDEDGTRTSPDLSTGQRSTPIPIAGSSDGAHRLSRKDKSSKKKSGWLSAIKQAGSALSTSSSSSSQPRYSISASSSGTDPTGSQGKEGKDYQPPWLMAGGGSREEKSGLASKLKFKRRSVADRRDKGTSSGGEGGDVSTSLNSRKMFETDDEADDGEAREGKAWEDVPLEALAMVIPLAVPKSPASVHTPQFSSPDSSPDVAKDAAGGWANRHSIHIDPLAAIDDIPPPRRKGRERMQSTLPALRPENSLLVYFVPFGCDVDRDGVCHDLSHAHGSTSATPTGPSRIFQHMRLKRPGSQNFSRGTSTPPPQLSTSGGSTGGGSSSAGGGGGGSTTRPPSGYLGSNLSYNSTTSNGSGGVSSSTAGGAPSAPLPSDVAFSSFRIVARVVDPSDLTFIPSWPSWESQGPAPHASSQPQVMLSEPGTNPETKAKESRTGRTDPTVVGVYHGGGEAGVEFIREGWERLGFVRPMPDEGDSAFTAGGGGPFTKEAPLWGSVDEDGETALGSVLGAVTAACVAILSPPES